jgi:hypothetical protein
MIKKIISLLIVIIFCVSTLVGCAQDDGVPNGMFSATIKGEPFTLFVPNGWTDNRDSGISSAYYGLNVIASARYYTPEDANTTLSDYVDEYIESCKQTYEDFSFTRKDAALGKNTPAVRIEYDFSRDTLNESSKASKAKAVQYIAMHNGDAIMLSFYCESSAFEEYAEVFEQIRKEFLFGEKSVVNDIATDKKTPDGMKLASEDNIEYRFYIPNEWNTDLSDGASIAFYSESGRPNVSVSSYSLREDMDAKTYFSLCEEDYKKTLEGYELISSEERKIHDIDAVSYTYKTVYGSAELRLMQTVFIYNGSAYSITYTALADRFEAHLDDVEQMLSAFRFR